MRRRLYLDTDGSEQPIDSLLKVKQSKHTARNMKMELIACPETSVTTNLLCVKCQKSLYLIYTAAEASNHAM